MAITASLVKELRERTGSGMMECKKALKESNGNVEAAKQALRELYGRHANNTLRLANQLEELTGLELDVADVETRLTAAGIEVEGDKDAIVEELDGYFARVFAL